jgi:hypothetical protein
MRINMQAQTQQTQTSYEATIANLYSLQMTMRFTTGVPAQNRHLTPQRQDSKSRHLQCYMGNQTMIRALILKSLLTWFSAIRF